MFLYLHMLYLKAWLLLLKLVEATQISLRCKNPRELWYGVEQDSILFLEDIEVKINFEISSFMRATLVPEFPIWKCFKESQPTSNQKYQTKSQFSNSHTVIFMQKKSFSKNNKLFDFSSDRLLCEFFWIKRTLYLFNPLPCSSCLKWNLRRENLTRKNLNCKFFE